jgi:hypothetical protein
VSTYIEELQEVISKLHGVQSMHVDSVPVMEILDDNTVWEGIVEVFELQGHPTAPIVYAWAQDTNDPVKPRKHFAVLHLHPVDSPEAAVRAAIVLERGIGEGA